jgi:hypothetical protein
MEREEDHGREEGQVPQPEGEEPESPGRAWEPELLRQGEGYREGQAVRTGGRTWQYVVVAALFLGLAFLVARRWAKTARAAGSSPL